MGLYERLMGDEAPRLPIHEFCAFVAEVRRGKRTNGQLVNAFNFSAGEQTELQAIKDRLDAATDPLTVQELEHVLLLAHQKTSTYTTKAAVKTALGIS